MGNTHRSAIKIAPLVREEKGKRTRDMVTESETLHFTHMYHNTSLLFYRTIISS